MPRPLFATDPVRSALMSRVRTSGTAPELAMRILVRSLGATYRLGGGGLPGRPDLCNKRHHWAIFVHGCFWHWHKPCRRRPPIRNAAYWAEKFTANRMRDARAIHSLRAMGFRVLLVWECELKCPGLAERLARFLIE